MSRLIAILRARLGELGECRILLAPQDTNSLAGLRIRREKLTSFAHRSISAVLSNDGPGVGLTVLIAIRRIVTPTLDSRLAAKRGSGQLRELPHPLADMTRALVVPAHHLKALKLFG